MSGQAEAVGRDAGAEREEHHRQHRLLLRHRQAQALQTHLHQPRGVKRGQTDDLATNYLSIGHGNLSIYAIYALFISY